LDEQRKEEEEEEEERVLIQRMDVNGSQGVFFSSY